MVRVVALTVLVLALAVLWTQAKDSMQGRISLEGLDIVADPPQGGSFKVRDVDILQRLDVCQSTDDEDLTE